MMSKRIGAPDSPQSRNRPRNVLPVSLVSAGYLSSQRRLLLHQNQNMKPDRDDRSEFPQPPQQSVRKPVYANDRPLGIGVQIAEAFRDYNINRARFAVHAHANILCQRNQEFAIRCVHYQDGGAWHVLAGDLDVADPPDSGAAGFANLAAGQIGDVVASGGKRHAFGQRDLHFEANKLLGVGNRIKALEMKDCLSAAALAQPARANPDAPWLAAHTRQLGRSEGLEPLGEVGEDFAGYFAAATVRPQDARDGNAR